MARPEKASAVAEITERFKEADAALLTEYRGLRVAEMAELRGALREANADYKVLKNTLARIAVRELGQEELVDMLTGPTAVVFVKGDVVEAAKALDDAVKKFPVLVVKGGTLKGGKLIDADEAKALAKLESREVLLTKIAMMLNQPAQQTVNVLSALLRDLGSMLGQVLAEKESEAPAAEPEAPAAEAPEAAAETDAAPAAIAEASEGQAPDAEAPDAEDVGVPSPEAETAEGKAGSAEDTDGDEDSSDDSSDSSDSDSSEDSSDDPSKEEE